MSRRDLAESLALSIMHTFKPSCLSMLTRCVEQRGLHYLAVCVLAHVPLRGPRRLCSEQSLWTLMGKAAPGYVEACMPKINSEFMLYGTVHPGIGSTQTHTEFGVRFAGLVKGGVARGVRVSDGRHVVRALPFEPVAIDAANSYGGPAYKDNPLGTGHPSSRREDGLLLLPRIELISHPWHEAVGRNSPALFGALDITHTGRARYAGTYDDRWLKEHAPGLPPDANWLIFNAASADQQREAPFAGNEAYDLLNLFPDASHVDGTLPSVQARVVLRRKSAPGALEDVATHLRTVVFLPDVDRMVLTWQGLCRIDTDDASDIDLLMLACEHLGQPKPIEHYANVIASRLDPDDGLYATLREDELLPQDLPFEGLLPPDLDLNRTVADDRLQARMRQRTERHMQAQRTRVAKENLDPDEHAPPEHLPPLPVFPPLHQIGQWSRQLDVKAQEETAKARKEQEQQLEAASGQHAKAGGDFAEIRREMAGEAARRPPEPGAPPRIAKLREMDELAQSQSTEVDELKEMLADEALQQRWHDDDLRMAKAYQEGAHAKPPPPRTQGDEAARQRQWVQACIDGRKPLSGFDLTGADLRGLDLSGLDASEAWLEGADLTGVRLVGTCFRDAVLAHAILTDAVAQEADFTRTNLGRARCERLSAPGALFEETQLFEAVLTQGRFEGARFVGAQFYRAVLTGLDLRRAQLQQAQFLQSNLSGSDLSEADIDEAQFIGGNLKGTRFQGARGRAVVFLHLTCPEGDFRGANLPNSRWVGRVDLSGARFDAAVLSHSYFGQGSVLQGATLDEVMADGIDWSACNLEGAKMRRVRMREASLRRANCRDANFAGSDMMSCILTNARLEGAQLVGCNLYGAELSRIQVDTRTQFTASLTDRAKLFPRWKPVPEVTS